MAELGDTFPSKSLGFAHGVMDSGDQGMKGDSFSGVTVALFAAMAPFPAKAIECGPTVVELEADLCTPYLEPLTVTIRMLDPTLPIVGGQFFLEYSFTNYDLLWAEAGDDPITALVFMDEPEPGLIRILVGSFLSQATSDTVMARLGFEVVDDTGKPFIRFHPGGEPRNLLAVEGGGELNPIFVNPDNPNEVDLHDFADFQNCFSGNGTPAATDCQCVFDTDDDQDVDYVDWNATRAKITGLTASLCMP